jgi:hypothetical protein
MRKRASADLGFWMAFILNLFFQSEWAILAGKNELLDAEKALEDAMAECPLTVKSDGSAATCAEYAEDIIARV